MSIEPSTEPDDEETEAGPNDMAAAAATAAGNAASWYVATKVFAFLVVMAMMCAFWIEPWFGWVMLGCFGFTLLGLIPSGYRLGEYLGSFFFFQCVTLPVAAIVNWLA